MRLFTLTFSLTLLHLATFSSGENVCGDWSHYTEFKCIKLFATVSTQSYQQASKICSGNGSRLVTIENSAEQAALEQYLFKGDFPVVDGVWLGATDEDFDEFHLPYNSSAFHWEERDRGLPLTFTNWAAGQPAKPPTKFAKTCLQLGSVGETKGKWSNEPCAKRNLVVCEKDQIWSMARMQKLLVKVMRNPVPVGFTYVQLPKQKSPQEIWPWMSWSDDSPAYDGVFFRVASGRLAAPFGSVQEDYSPFIDQIRYSYCHDTCSDQKENVTISRKAGGWTGNLVAAKLYSGNSKWTNEYLNFHTASVGEVRPRNMAVKVWRRTG